MRLAGDKERVAAAKAAGARWTERRRSGVSTEDCAQAAGVSANVMLDIFREHGLNLRQQRRDDRISLAKPYGGKQSSNNRSARREPDMDAMMDDARRDVG